MKNLVMGVFGVGAVILFTFFITGTINRPDCNSHRVVVDPMRSFHAWADGSQAAIMDATVECDTDRTTSNVLYSVFVSNRPDMNMATGQSRNINIQAHGEDGLLFDMVGPYNLDAVDGVVTVKFNAEPVPNELLKQISYVHVRFTDREANAHLATNEP